MLCIPCSSVAENCCSIIFCEVVAIYGVIIGIVYSAKLLTVPDHLIYTNENYYTGKLCAPCECEDPSSSLVPGFAIFWGGITVGLCNFLCGLTVGIAGKSA